MNVIALLYLLAMHRDRRIGSSAKLAIVEKQQHQYLDSRAYPISGSSKLPVPTDEQGMAQANSLYKGSPSLAQ